MNRVSFTDEQLKIAVTAYAETLLEAEKAEAEGVSEHVFSESSEERVRRCAAKYCSRKTARRRKASSGKVLRRAAAVLIVLVLSFSMVMAFSTEARAAVSNWIIETHDKIVRYQFNRQNDSRSFIICTPKGIPDGFERTHHYRNDYYCRNLYTNSETGEYIKFEYFRPTEKDKRKIEKTGQNAEVYYVFDYYEMYYTEASGKSCACWYDPDRDLAFYAEGNTEKDIFINCFKEIDFRLPRYEATWLPEGIVAGDITSIFLETSIDYYNETGDVVLVFSYMDIAETDAIFITKGIGENSDYIFYESLYINNCSARYYPPAEHDIGAELVWVDEKEQLVFVISGIINRKDMINYAESIVCVEDEW